jgi:hypothetical protein
MARDFQHDPKVSPGGRFDTQSDQVIAVALLGSLRDLRG